MDKTTIAKLRLQNQQIVKSPFTRAEEIVSWLGAVQAQDYNMAKWAIGLRLNSATARTIEDEIDSGSIIRTHVMRPTWHFVASKDIRWLLELTASRIRSATDHRRRWLELDARTLNRANKVMAKALEGENHLTRQELMTRLQKSGVETNTQRATHIMLNAELEGIVCNGKLRGKQFTYALMDERVPAARSTSREEAITKLAKRYFQSHGPATLKDFAWCSGLSQTDAKIGLENIKTSLHSEVVDSETYWMGISTSPHTDSKRTIHFLPAYDEFTVAYKDRTASLTPEAAKIAITGYAIFNPTIVVNGRIVGIWKRTFAKDRVAIEKHFLPDAGRFSEKTLSTAARRFAAFHEVEAVLS